TSHLSVSLSHLKAVNAASNCINRPQWIVDPAVWESAGRQAARRPFPGTFKYHRRWNPRLPISSPKCNGYATDVQRRCRMDFALKFGMVVGIAGGEPRAHR